MKPVPILVPAVCALAGALVASAAPVPYTDPSVVDLLRRVDESGNLVTAAVAAPGSSNPGYPYDAARLNDAGVQPWRITGHQATETWQITLPEAVDITTLDLYMRGSFYATDYVVRGSLTGFGSMTDLVTVTGNTNAHPVHTIASTSVQYLEMQATAFANATYYITHEVSAYGPGPVYQRSGYNMFYEPGKVGTITANMSRNVVDPVANAADRNLNSYVRGGNLDSGPDSWFVLPLAERTELMAMSIGMYEDQPWSDVKVYVSNDDAYNYLNVGGTDTWPGMTWTQVFDWPTSNFRGTHFTMTPQDVTFIRVEWPKSNSALCELEVFETYYVPEQQQVIPEPASALMLLVGAGVLGRRRRKA